MVPGVVSGVSSEGGGVVWFLVPSVPFYLSVPSLRVRSISPYRIEAWQCAPFLSARFPSLTAFVCVRLRSSAFVFARLRSSRSSSRLVRLVRRLVSILCLCGSPVVPSCSSIRSAVRCLVSSGGPVSRLVHRSSMFRLAWLIVSRLVFSSCLLVSSSSPYSLVSPGGSSRRFVVSGSVLSSRSLLFSFHLSVASHVVVMMVAARHSHIVAACFRPHCLPSWNPIWRWRRAE